MRRWQRLPDLGHLMVSTDLHGNGGDFRRLREHFLSLQRQATPVYWVILGDVVHAPDETSRRRRADLYDYPDESLAIVEGILTLMAEHPGRVLYVLGNHDHGHVGGPSTGKFYPNEVAQLERTIGPAGAERLRQLFAPALLAVVAPCGVLLTHGSPDDRLARLDDLDDVSLVSGENDSYHAHVLETLLTSYGQPAEVTARLLSRLSTPDLSLSLVIHGHDRDESGYFIEGDNQVCPVIFGAARHNKRFVVLNLAARYPVASSLREGIEIRRLYEA